MLSPLTSRRNASSWRALATRPTSHMSAAVPAALSALALLAGPQMGLPHSLDNGTPVTAEPGRDKGWSGSIPPPLRVSETVRGVLEQFHRHLKRRDIYAAGSSRWRDPNAQLLEGTGWAAVKDSVLTDLGLPEDPDELLARHAVTLHETYTTVSRRLAVNTAVTCDEQGRVHVASVKAIEEPPSLVDLRKRVEAMMPRVDISEAILEVLGWCPEFITSLASISGTEAHLADLDITVAACLTGQALNITYAPIAVKGVPALERHRIGYVDHTYLRAENYAAGICTGSPSRPASASPRPWAAGWSPPSTACVSSSPSRAPTPGRTGR